MRYGVISVVFIIPLRQAKVYLTDALGAVVENINAIACASCFPPLSLPSPDHSPSPCSVAQLDDLVNLQVDAVDGLTTQIQQIKT